MPDTSRLRIVGPEPDRPARRRPGLAVVLILLYALAFAAALWLLRAASPLFRRPGARAQASSSGRPPASTRATLLAGAGLASVSRSEYFRRLSATCCTCGCDLNLRDCLLTDQSCSRSPAAAQALADELR